MRDEAASVTACNEKKELRLMLPPLWMLMRLGLQDVPPEPVYCPRCPIESNRTCFLFIRYGHYAFYWDSTGKGEDGKRRGKWIYHEAGGLTVHCDKGHKVTLTAEGEVVVGQR